MSHDTTLDELWETAPPATRLFDRAAIGDLPEAAQRYLDHAIAPSAPLASAVRLRMHGEIKLNRWLPFSAEEVISPQRGMIWDAVVRRYGLSIRGFDRLVDGVGLMHWRLLGVIRVLTAAGPDIDRSAAGRLAAEMIWLPTMLCRPEVSWTGVDPTRARAALAVQGHEAELEIITDGDGQLEAARLPRWGDPDRSGFRTIDFGCIAGDEATFADYTIPTRLRVGWFPGTERFESEGEFFRVTVDDAVYR